MNETLLDYAINPTPNPIQASPSTGDPNLASLTLVVSNHSGDIITCSSISLSFTSGTNAEDFCSDPTGISSSPQTGWSVQQEDGLFTFTPDTQEKGQVGGDGLVFGLSGIKVNQQPGPFQITLDEKASDSDALPPAPDQTRSRSWELAKFPAQFTVGDLNANPPIVESGGSTTLSWSGSGGSGNYNAVYEIQYVDADGKEIKIDHPKGEQNQPLPPVGGYTVDGLKKDPTTFYLLVTVQTQGSNNPLVIQRDRPVTVTAPHPPEPEVTCYTGEPQPDGSLLFEWTASPPEATVEITSIPIIFQNTGTYPFHPTPEQPLLSSFTLTAKNGPKSASKTLVQQGFQPAAGSLVTVGNEPLSVAVSPDGARVFVADRNDTLTVLDAHTLQPVAGSPVTVGSSPSSSSVAVSPDATRVFVANSDRNTLTVLDAHTLQPAAGSPVTVGNGPSSVAVSRDGTRVFVANSGHNTLTVLDAHALQPVAGSPVTVGNGPWSVAVSRDGKRVFVANQFGNTLTVLDAHTLQPVAGSPVTVGNGPWSVAVSGDGKRVFVANQQDQTLTVLDAQKLQPVAGSPVTVGAYPTSVAISPDGTRVFVANLMGNTLTVLDTQKLQPAQGSPVTVGTYPTSVAMSPDGTFVFVANYGDNNLTVLGPAAYVPAQAG
jgi:YVTN family beta-propeller protein